MRHPKYLGRQTVYCRDADTYEHVSVYQSEDGGTFILRDRDLVAQLTATAVAVPPADELPEPWDGLS